MKNLIYFLLPLLLPVGIYTKVQAQDFYNLPVKDINKSGIDLQRLKGKKIMLCILSGSAADSSFLKQLTSFEERYKDSVQLIGLAINNGNDTAAGEQSMRRYKTEKKSRMQLTTYLRGKKAEPLLDWLTEAGKNKHFTVELKAGAGQKFFIDEKGELYAVLGPEVPLSSKFIERVLSRTTQQP